MGWTSQSFSNRYAHQTGWTSTSCGWQTLIIRMRHIQFWLNQAIVITMIYGSTGSAYCWFCSVWPLNSISFDFHVWLRNLEDSFRSLCDVLEVGHIVVSDTWNCLYWSPAPTFLVAERSKFGRVSLHALSVCDVLMRSRHHKLAKWGLSKSLFVSYGRARAPTMRFKRWLGDAIVAHSWVTQVVGPVEDHHRVTVSAGASWRTTKEVADSNGVLVEAFAFSNSFIFTARNVAARFRGSVGQWPGEGVLWLVTNGCLSHWLANNPTDFVISWSSRALGLGLIHIHQRETLSVGHLEIAWQHARVPLSLPWSFVFSGWVGGLVVLEAPREGLPLLWSRFYQLVVCLASVWCPRHLVVALVWIVCVFLEDLAVLDDVIDLEYFVLWLTILRVRIVSELLQIAGSLVKWSGVGFGIVCVEVCWNEFISISTFVHWDVCLGQVLEVSILCESSRVCTL